MIEVFQTDDLTACHKIRRIVFVEGQGVLEAEEIDGQDSACMHFLAVYKGESVGTLRLKPVSDGYKIQRVAVLPSFQGQGVGAAMMQHVVEQFNTKRLMLDSQVAVMGFYKLFGFEPEGPTFYDARILHRHMVRVAR